MRRREALELPANEAHVWFAWQRTLLSSQSRLECALSLAERQRARSYRRPADRLRQIVGHGALRVVLAHYLDRCPAEVPIRQFCTKCHGPHGPLRVPELYASLAYAPDVTAIAVARSPVGVDIEPLPPRVEWRRVVGLLSETEQLAIERLPELERPNAVIGAWTIREAVGKATGRGLALADSDLGPPPASARWSVRDLARIPQHLGAVAVAARGISVRVKELPSSMIM